MLTGRQPLLGAGMGKKIARRNFERYRRSCGKDLL